MLPLKNIKEYSDQGNKNSILFKFRSEVFKSQQMVDREIERTIKLKIKYNKKKRLKTSQNDFRKNLMINPDSNSSVGINSYTTNNNFYRFNNINNPLKPNLNVNFASNSNTNNFFSTQIFPNQNSDNIASSNNEKELIIFKKDNSSIFINSANNFYGNNNTQRKANNTLLNSNPNSNENKLGFLKDTGMVGLNNMNETVNSGMESKAAQNKFSKTSENFLIKNQLAPSSRLKTYNVFLINNWFDRNQIPYQNYNNFIVNNLEFQSNTIIDQMKVLLDSINHFKLSFLQGKNVKK